MTKVLPRRLVLANKEWESVVGVVSAAAPGYFSGASIKGASASS